MIPIGPNSPKWFKGPNPFPCARHLINWHDEGCALQFKPRATSQLRAYAIDRAIIKVIKYAPMRFIIARNRGSRVGSGCALSVNFDLPIMLD